MRGAQIGAIVRFTPLAMVANGLVAGILLVALHGYGQLGRLAVVWGCVIGGAVLRYGRVWLRTRRADGAGRPASRIAVWRAVLHGGFFGALWGAVPMLFYSGSPAPLQMLAACVMVGMICGGGFVLATVPLAGGLYVFMLLAGSTAAILEHAGGVPDLELLALLWVYAATVMIFVCCNAQLFVERFLVEARLKTEILARERAQAEVARSQRMSALGALAGGVAHDFNNILQSVTGNATMVARRTEDPQQVRQLAGLILDAAERGGAISRRLLAFARQDALSAEPVDVGDILQNAADLLEHMLHRSICLTVCAPPDLPPVLADKAQLETVLVNLAANARDAMRRGGTLQFEAMAETVPLKLTQPDLAAGLYVRISVSDTGDGMDPETLAHAAEPFFTTKPAGKGTGLGLSMAKGFAEQSGGAFAIASERGIGTMVTLWLPRAPGKMAAQRSFVQPPPPAPAWRLLVVEDDVDVRDSLVRTLEDAGFDLVGVGNATVAQDLIARGLRVDLVITDYSMPGPSGLDLLDEVQAQRPGLPAILLTGHLDDVSVPSRERFVLLQKPVHPNQLIHHVWQCLATAMVS